MCRHRAVTSIVLLVAFGHVILHGQEEPLPGGSAPCLVEGGIYRPFNLIRQFKLATAYFVDPNLPDEARILYGYNLEVMKDNRFGDNVQLAVSVDNMEGALAPVHWVESGGRMVLSPCRPLSSEAGGGATMTIDAMARRAEQGIAVWIEELPEDTRKDIYVLSSDVLLEGPNDRWVTWDPTEAVMAVEPGERP